MAASASVINDLTTCPICVEVFDNPKSLPCLHAFCLKCLERHFKDNSPGDDVPCPLCRREFRIPPDGLVGLQHHFFIQHLVDARNASSKSTNGVACEVCLGENEGSSEEISTATIYCIDCKQKLCERCSRPHKKMASGAHLLKPLGAELEQELIQLRGSYCDKHKDKQVELYCHDCDENICLMCSAVKHKNHESSEIPEAAGTFRSRIDDDDNKIASRLSGLSQQSQKTKYDMMAFSGKADDLEKLVIEAGDAIKRLVDTQVSEFLIKLQSVKSDSARQAKIVQEQLQLAMVTMESFHTYSRELLDKGRPSDITRAASELHKRATKLLDYDVTSAQYCPPHVTFSPADVTQLPSLQLIGKLTVIDDYGNDSVGSVLHTLPEGNTVCGVTSLDNLLYMLRNKASDQIEVYDMHTNCLQRQFTVPGLGSMSDMTACAYNVCIYISGGVDKCVHRVALSSDDVTMSKCSVNDIADGLSVTDTHSVLVMCSTVKKFKEFTTNGKLLRETKLPQEVVSPWHTIQLSSGEFIVCHGDTTDPIHDVCLIGSDGHVVKSYGGPKGSGSQQMHVPCHMAVDRNGCVFVADSITCRVLLLSPDLTFMREVASREQLKWGPLRLYLDVDRRRLYVAVGEWKNGKFTAGRVVVIRV